MRRSSSRRLSALSAAVAVLALVLAVEPAFAARVFRAGACEVDISPETLPIRVSGSFLSRTADSAIDSLHARSLALDDGRQTVVIAIVDTLMMSREMLDEVKEAAARSTGVPPSRMLIAATHTHSAPPVMGALGTDAEPDYARFLKGRLVQTIEGAAASLQPAQIGWASVADPEHTHCRRWILRPDKMRTDPFGELTVRAHMHPGYQNPDFVGPAGPVDPSLTLLAVRSAEGKPLALLANYSMHYVGVTGGVISSDYYGPFVEEIRRLAGAPLVAMMSQGTSGDQHWMDYSQPKKEMNVRIYAEAMARVAHRVWQKIGHYRDWAPVAMAEKTLTLRRRVPDDRRLAWARRVFAEVPEGKPRNQVEVYAREQILLAEEPVRELKLQALRIGDLGITAIPNEVFAITGLKIRARSPLAGTVNITLANGAEGYIPPPEQHKLGGYTTWPARTAALETEAEPKIVETLLDLLEKISGKPRRKPAEPMGAYPKAVLASRPLAYWRLGESSGQRALDAAGRHHAHYEDGIAFHLPGPQSQNFSAGEVNRSPHFAGGRLTTPAGPRGGAYTVEFWFWNGLPADARAVTGYLFSLSGDELSIGGTEEAAGKLLFSRTEKKLAGSAEVGLRTWNHVAVTREGRRVQVYLNGNATPEISGEFDGQHSRGRLLIGGREDNFCNFEGKIDEVALYGRALTAGEIAGHYKAAGL